MGDWERKERFKYPSARDWAERHAPEEAPGFWDKYGEIVVILVLMIVVAAILEALGIETPRQMTPRLSP